MLSSIWHKFQISLCLIVIHLKELTFHKCINIWHEWWRSYNHMILQIKTQLNNWIISRSLQLIIEVKNMNIRLWIKICMRNIVNLSIPLSFGNEKVVDFFFIHYISTIANTTVYFVFIFPTYLENKRDIWFIKKNMLNISFVKVMLIRYSNIPNYNCTLFYVNILYTSHSRLFNYHVSFF